MACARNLMKKESLSKAQIRPESSEPFTQQGITKYIKSLFHYGNESSECFYFVIEHVQSKVYEIYMRYLKRAFIEGAQLLRELSCISYVEHLLGLYVVSCNAFAIRLEKIIFQKYLSNM